MQQFKAAFHTISWGNRFTSREHLQKALKLIKDAGFEGVEFSQRPDANHLCVPNLATLRQLTDPLGLTILGFAGGTLLDRMIFCGSDTRPYLLVYDGNEKFLNRAAETFTLGLHQRVFSRTSTLRKAELLLDAHPNLKFIPDTAHLTIAGDDLLMAINKWGKDRLIAVHLVYSRIREKCPKIPIVAISIESELIIRIRDRFAHSDPHLLAKERTSIDPDALAILLGGNSTLIDTRRFASLTAPGSSRMLPSKETIVRTTRRSQWFVLGGSMLAAVGEVLAKASEHKLLSWLNESGPLGFLAEQVVKYTLGHPYWVYLGILLTYLAIVIGCAQVIDYRHRKGMRILDVRPLLSFEYWRADGGFDADEIVISNRGEVALDVEIAPLQVMLDTATFELVGQIEPGQKRRSRIRLLSPIQGDTVRCSKVLDNWLVFLNRSSLSLPVSATYRDTMGTQFRCWVEMTHRAVRDGPASTTFSFLADGLLIVSRPSHDSPKVD